MVEPNTSLSAIMLFFISKYFCPLIERKSYLLLNHFICNVLFWHWWFQNLPMWCPSGLAFIAHNLFNMWISSWWLSYHLNPAMAFLSNQVSLFSVMTWLSYCNWYPTLHSCYCCHHGRPPVHIQATCPWRIFSISIQRDWILETFPPALFFFTWEIIHTFLRIAIKPNVLVNIILSLFSSELELWWSSIQPARLLSRGILTRITPIPIEFIGVHLNIPIMGQVYHSKSVIKMSL